MLNPTLIHLRTAAGILAAAAVLAACTSVNLDPDYAPPPIVLPGEKTPEPAQPERSQPAESRPVKPSQTELAPLPPVTADNPDAHLVTLTTDMRGDQVVPPTRTQARGHLDALYDADTGVLRWRASWSDLTGQITDIQFQGPAAAGENAPATMIWPGPFGSRYEGRGTVTPEQGLDLRRGLWSVTVYTTEYLHGEIRGQLEVVD